MENHTFNPELVFQQAMQAHQTGLHEKAEQLLNEILDHLPDNDGIMSTLGGILMSRGAIQESIPHFEKALRINPSNAEAHLNIGIAFQSLNSFEKSFTHISKAADLAPERADIQFNLANSLIQHQQYQKAIQVLNRVIELNPQFIQAYLNLGVIYSYLGQLPNAIIAYKKALEVRPDDLNTLITLGNLYADSGQTALAEKTYTKAISSHPNHFLPYAVLGKLFLDLGKDKAGEDALQKAFSLNPGDLNTNILLGNVYKQSGNIEEAEKYYRQALNIDPENQGALSNLRRIMNSKIPYWHFEMLADTERNHAYQTAIEKAVNQDDLILDIGTGSGLLSMMAARSGAKEVVACEMHQQLAKTAKDIVKLNGYEEVISVYNMKSTKLKVGKEVPAKVDLIISEILDVGALGEGALPSIRHAVQNLAKPDVKLIPAGLQLYGQLIEIPSRSLVAPVQNISGFDLSPFEQFRIPNEYLKINLNAEKYKILSSTIHLMDIDFYNLPPAYSDDQPNQIQLQIPIEEEGVLQAMVFWFDLDLDDEIKVSSRKDGELEHWGQALFCFPNTRKVQPGENVPVTLLQSDQLIKFKL